MFESLKSKVSDWFLSKRFGLQPEAVSRLVRLGRIYDHLSDSSPVFGTARSLAESWVEDNPMNLPRPDEDENQWTTISGGSTNSVYDRIYTDDYRVSMLKWARYACRVLPHGNAVDTIKNFVSGKGAKLVFSEGYERLQSQWDKWEKLSGFNRRQKEIIRRIIRDGECFLRWFVGNKGIPDFRFIDPLDIRTPSYKQADVFGGVCVSGIVFNPEDYRDVFGYWICRDKTEEYVEAKEIIAFKNCDETEARGMTYLESVLPAMQAYSSWLNNRVKMSRTQSFFAIHKKITNGTPSQVSDLRGFPTTEYATTNSGRYRSTAIKPGSILTTSDNIQYELLTPKSYATDAKADGRAILLTIAAGLGISEYMITGDASNNNRASIEVAETPSVRNFEDWQDSLADFFLQIASQVLMLDNVEVTITWPRIVARNEQSEVMVSTFLLDNKLASKHTIAGKFDIDLDEEMKTMESEPEEEESDEDEVPKADKSGEEDEKSEDK